MYQQRQSQWAGASGPQGMSVSGGQGNATAKKLLFILGGVILGGLLLLIGSIFLALISPAPLSTFFWVVAVVIFVIAWIIYSTIRRMIRRTIGGLWRFF
jgi:hypothetical protein